MRVEYDCHACLAIDTGDIRIVTDPWFDGPAYCNQWHLFPKPIDLSSLAEVDVVLVSHGHEDHLHAPSLSKLPGNARVFYPYNSVGAQQTLDSESPVLPRAARRVLPRALRWLRRGEPEDPRHVIPGLFWKTSKSNQRPSNGEIECECSLLF